MLNLAFSHYGLSARGRGWRRRRAVRFPNSGSFNSERSMPSVAPPLIAGGYTARDQAILCWEMTS